MTAELDDFDLWPPPEPSTREPAKCRRHRWTDATIPVSCARCSKPRDDVLVRRGKNNRARGGKAELDVARSIGGRKVGPLGQPWDVELEGYMRLQVKKLIRWPSLATVVNWMQAIPIGRDMRGVVVMQPGRGGQRLLVLDLDEFARWHGDPTEDVG